MSASCSPLCDLQYTALFMGLEKICDLQPKALLMGLENHNRGRMRSSTMNWKAAACFWMLLLSNQTTAGSRKSGDHLPAKLQLMATDVLPAHALSALLLPLPLHLASAPLAVPRQLRSREELVGCAPQPAHLRLMEVDRAHSTGLDADEV